MSNTLLFAILGGLIGLAVAGFGMFILGITGRVPRAKRSLYVIGGLLCTVIGVGAIVILLNR